MKAVDVKRKLIDDPSPYKHKNDLLVHGLTGVGGFISYKETVWKPRVEWENTLKVFHLFVCQGDLDCFNVCLEVLKLPSPDNWIYERRLLHAICQSH